MLHTPAKPLVKICPACKFAAVMARDRDYRQEYDSYHASPEQIARRSSRNKARRLMQKRYGREAMRGKDVDHKDFNASHNGSGNLRLMDWRKNRSRQPKRS